MHQQPATKLPGSTAAPHCIAAPPSNPDYTRVVTAAPRPWAGAKLGKCLANVREMVCREGGEAVCGWALEQGPLRQQGWYPPPLYCRWLHHVVWRDTAGMVWEVSPNIRFECEGGVCFLPTQFYADPAAEFRGEDGDEWASLPCCYLPLRPEGEAVAGYLTRGQAATKEADRNHWIQEALAGLKAAGFVPREWKVETVGQRTGTIWLIAE